MKSRLHRIIREQRWTLVGGPQADLRERFPDLVLICVTPKSVVDQIAQLKAEFPTSVIVALGEATIAARRAALASGATDFIQHDASTRYVTARLGAIMRLYGHVYQHGCVRAGPLVLDMTARRCTLGNTHIALSPREFDLLSLLARNYGHPVRRSELIEQVWSDSGDPGDNTLEAVVSRIRRKLRIERQIELTAMRGIGYRLQGKTTSVTPIEPEKGSWPAPLNGSV